MSSDLQDQLQSVLGQRYQVISELGGGGMSRVFAAIDAATGARVAVKVLSPDLAAGVDRERFRREIRVALRLEHPRIVPVLSDTPGSIRNAGSAMPGQDNDEVYGTLLGKTADELDHLHTEGVL